MSFWIESANTRTWKKLTRTEVKQFTYQFFKLYRELRFMSIKNALTFSHEEGHDYRTQKEDVSKYWFCNKKGQPKHAA